MTLSRRQTQCVELLAHGLVTKEIADRLGIAHKTARTHIEAMMKRLKAKTRAHAVYLHYR